MSTATELLRRALKFLDYRRIGSDTLEKDIKTFLAAEPEAESVAWIKRQYAGTGQTLTSIFYRPEPGAVPLYTKPEPARKPMTEEEIEETCDGIGVNPSDPDSIDLQSRCRGDKL